jgi:hypothetical protein
MIDPPPFLAATLASCFSLRSLTVIASTDEARWRANLDGHVLGSDGGVPRH